MPSDVISNLSYRVPSARVPSAPFATPPDVASRAAGLPRTRTNFDQSGSDQCRAVLDQLLRQTVISRLRLAHPEGTAAPEPGAGRRPRHEVEAADVERFVGLLRGGSQAEVDACAETMIEQGYDLDTVYLDILPLAEARLSAMARAGDNGLSDLILGSWRLQELIERLAPRFQTATATTRHGRRALLGSCEPTEQRLRLLVGSEGLLRDGWDAWPATHGTAAELIELVRLDWFCLAVIASDHAVTDTLGGLIRGLRRASANPDLRVLVVSAALARRPDRMARLGADAAAPDLRQALVQARRLCALMPSVP